MREPVIERGHELCPQLLLRLAHRVAQKSPCKPREVDLLHDATATLIHRHGSRRLRGLRPPILAGGPRSLVGVAPMVVVIIEVHRIGHLSAEPPTAE